VSDRYPHVRVVGGPRERGRQYGEQARDRVLISLAAYAEVFGHYAGWNWAKVTAEARLYEPAIAAYDERYLEEVRGIAEGAGVGAQQVLDGRDRAHDSPPAISSGAPPCA